MPSSAATRAIWSTRSGDHARAVFAAEGIRCAACSRTIERAVTALPGVEHINVNVATARIGVEWRPSTTSLPQILDAIESAGFKPVPLAGEAAEQAHLQERRTALKRIGLAGIGMMQAMMYVLGVYVATPDSIDPAIASYLRYVGLLIATPVLFYSGAPFLLGAWRALRQRSLNMDVTVGLALVLAYAASVFNTVRGHGQTYFDSVTMFIFFLSAGRYVEMIVRQRSLSTSDALTRSLPVYATRQRADGTTEKIPIRSVAAGDRLVIPKGAVIPVDAQLAEGSARVDESLITGESTPLQRHTGESLLGGSVNTGNAIVIIASRDVASSTLASIVALLERAQSTRPRIALAADRIASVFIATILALTSLVAIAWIFVDPSRAFPAVLSVLVVTCPCALSLATPVAVAAATTRLARLGLLVTRADALERLARVDTVVFDKTGTLTGGTMSISNVTTADGVTRAEALAIAAALERNSTHPIASAFSLHGDSTVVAQEVAETAGQGIAGRIDGQEWRLGRQEFVTGNLRDAAPFKSADALWLGNDAGPVATFELGEQIHAEASAALASLRSLNITPVIASGDRVESVARVANTLGIANAKGRLDPAQKSELVRQLQRAGHTVLTLGDGVNDGPVLATADVSCAMGQGSAIAQAAADMLLLNDSLGAVAQAVATARRMHEVIRQNLHWALIYNLTAVPLAAFDLVPPWLAAVGMSVSSLVVVLNARRLTRTPRTHDTPAPPTLRESIA